MERHQRVNGYRRQRGQPAQRNRENLRAPNPERYRRGRTSNARSTEGVASPANERGGSPRRGVLRKKGFGADRRRSRRGHDDGPAKRRHLRALEREQAGNRGGPSLNPKTSGSVIGETKGAYFILVLTFIIFLYIVLSRGPEGYVAFSPQTYSAFTQTVGLVVKGMCCILVLIFTLF